MTFFDGVFFISSHLRKINKNYKLAYHHKLKSYVIYDTYKNEIVITFNGYPTYEIINKLFKTRKENFLKLIEEVEEQNQKTQNSVLNSAISGAKSQIEEIFQFSNKKPSAEINSKIINKIIR